MGNLIPVVCASLCIITFVLVLMSLWDNYNQFAFTAMAMALLVLGVCCCGCHCEMRKMAKTDSTV